MAATSKSLPVLGTIAVPVLDKSNHLLGFKMEWMDGKAPDGTTYELTGGAGVGSAYIEFLAKAPDGRRYDVAINVAAIFHQLVDMADAAMATQPTPDAEK